MRFITSGDIVYIKYATIITAQTSASTIFKNSRLYPLTDLRISVPDESFNSTSSLLFPIAINNASRNTMIVSHSVRPTLAMTAPALILKTKPIATIIMSRMGIVFRPKEYAIFKKIYRNYEQELIFYKIRNCKSCNYEKYTGNNGRLF